MSVVPVDDCDCPIFNPSCYTTGTGQYVDFPTAQGDTTVQSQTVNGGLYLSTVGIDGKLSGAVYGPVNIGPNSNVNIGTSGKIVQAKTDVYVSGNVYASNGLFDSVDDTVTVQLGGNNSSGVQVGSLGGPIGSVTGIYGGSQLTIQNYDVDGNSDMNILASNIVIGQSGGSVNVGTSTCGVSIISKSPTIGISGSGGNTIIYDSLNIGSIVSPSKVSFQTAVNTLMVVNGSAGTSGQVLTSGGASDNITWTTLATGTTVQSGETGVLSATSGTVTYSSSFATKPKVVLSLNTNGTTVFIPIGLFSHTGTGPYTGFTWGSATTSATATISWYATI